ncbi:hypothetical protein ACG3SL_21030 [Sphingomonas sp. CJ20]
MFRLCLTAAAALLLAGCSKAPEDLTARYTLAGGGGTIAVKAAANGDARVDSREQTLIRKGGVEYIVLNDPRGAYAAKVPEFVAVIGELAREAGMKPTGLGPQTDYAIVKEGTETVAEQKGDVWKVRPAKGAAKTTVEAVISSDPALANAGSALAMQTRFGAAGMAQVQGGLDNLEKRVAEMLDKGLVLRFGDALKLTEIERTPLPETLFALPTVLDKAALKARIAQERARAQAARAAGAMQPGAPARPLAPTAR